MKPKIDCHNQHTIYQREQHKNQQTSTAVRPPLPRDGSMDGRPYWSPGELPKGGYHSMWDFGEKSSTKNSPARANGKKIY